MAREIDGMIIYTVEEAAELLRIHPQTMREYLKSGRIRGRKLGIRWAITADAIKDYFRQGQEADKPKAEPADG